MGFFNKKPNKNKVYSLKEAMDFVSKNPNYTTIDTTGGFKIVDEMEERKHIDIFKERRNSFMKEINGNGAYINMPGVSSLKKEEIRTYQNRYSELGR